MWNKAGLLTSVALAASFVTAHTSRSNDRDHHGHHHAHHAAEATGELTVNMRFPATKEPCGSPPVVRSTKTVTVTAPYNSDVSNTSLSAHLSWSSWSNSTGSHAASPSSSSARAPSFSQQPSAASFWSASTRMSAASSSTVTSATSSESSASSLGPASSLGSTSAHATSPSLAPSAASSCPTEPTNFPDLPPLFGFDMNKYLPYDAIRHANSSGYRNVSTWQIGMQNLIHWFPKITAVRLYSTTDGDSNHLWNAFPGAKATGLKLVVGMWSTAPDLSVDDGRFDIEFRGLTGFINELGCDHIAAVSVGSEDIYRALPSASARSAKVDVLISQMTKVRAYLRTIPSCCHVPVTHAESSDQINDPAAISYVGRLLDNVDNGLMVNIFPYFGNADSSNMVSSMTNSVDSFTNITETHGKELWIGEAGWAHKSFAKQATTSPADIDTAQAYFQQVGCKILTGALGNSFYFIDWDEDNEVYGADDAAFGVFDYKGQPKFDVSCGENVGDSQ